MRSLKTKKGVKKRFKISKSGKVKYHHAFKSHILSSKKKSRKRKLRREGIVASSVEARSIRRHLPFA
ncbi:MAG: 50S ribosomal protein L35 [Candidatus Omnitrophota bacterium]